MWSMQLCEVFEEVFAVAGRSIIMIACGTSDQLEGTDGYHKTDVGSGLWALGVRASPQSVHLTDTRYSILMYRHEACFGCCCCCCCWNFAMPNVKGRHVQVLPRMRCIASLYLDITDVVVSQNQGYFFEDP